MYSILYWKIKKIDIYCVYITQISFIAPNPWTKGKRNQREREFESKIMYFMYENDTEWNGKYIEKAKKKTHTQQHYSLSATLFNTLKKTDSPVSGNSLFRGKFQNRLLNSFAVAVAFGCLLLQLLLPLTLLQSQSSPYHNIHKRQNTRNMYIFILFSIFFILFSSNY